MRDFALRHFKLINKRTLKTASENFRTKDLGVAGAKIIYEGTRDLEYNFNLLSSCIAF